jgi:hypothetical protein
MKRFRAWRLQLDSPNAAIWSDGPRRDWHCGEARMSVTARLKKAVLEEGEKTSEKRM